SIFRSKLLETLHMIALQAAKLLAPPVIRKLRSRRSCEPPRQPIFLATAEHRPDAASRRSLRAYASSGAFQRPLQRLNSLLQGGPLFRGQATVLRSTPGDFGSALIGLPPDLLSQHHWLTLRPGYKRDYRSVPPSLPTAPTISPR